MAESKTTRTTEAVLGTDIETVNSSRSERRVKRLGRTSTKASSAANRYLCGVERNQNGKYNVRIRVVFGQDGWVLPVYFLTSSFQAAMKKLEESLQYLQKNEDRLRFWGRERTDDPSLTGELLREFGLGFDRRRDMPRKTTELGVMRERPVTASVLGPIRRFLSDCLSQERPLALAGD